MATGIDIFGQLQGVWVHQQLHLIEIFNWERNNKYDLFPCDPKNPGQPSGPQVMHIAEECDCCTRQCCGSQAFARLSVSGAAEGGSVEDAASGTSHGVTVGSVIAHGVTVSV